MRKDLFALGLCFVSTGAFAANVDEIDWGKIPSTTVTLFYPGQSSYEWLQTKHPGAAAVKNGQACVACHKGAEKKLGAKAVKGGPLEPATLKGKSAAVDLKVQAAYDDKNAYLRFQWKTDAQTAGIEYPYYRYTGTEWKVYGGPRLDKAVQEGKQPAVYEDRFTVMLDDGKVPLFAKQGCWLTCHVGERDMPQTAAKDEAQKVLKKNDVRKYLPATRTNPFEWQTIKSPEEIAKLKAEGQFVDFFQWRAHRSNPIGMADDGYVLEYRNFDSGKNPFASNLDSGTKQPKFMFDAAKAGSKAVREGELGKKEHFLIKGVNAVAFDPNAGWKEGDMLPRYVLQPQDTTGSAADNKAKGTWKDGTWTIVIVRPLGLTNADDKALKPGGVYNVGFAVHDNNITTRGHHVSFTKTLGMGAKADIQATKLP